MLQFDIKTAFLYAPLDKPIYMQIPEGVECPEVTDQENKVLLLLKALYGLKQAPRQWNKKFSAFLENFKFKKCHSEWSVYVCKTPNGIIILALFVDDGRFFCN